MSSYEQQNKQQYHDQNQEDNKPFTQKLYQTTTTPTTRQTVKLITASTIGTALLVLSALVLTGTVIALVIATPIMVLFSPILVPAAITAFAIATGLVFSGACGVAALSALSWIYQYSTGKHPLGSDQLDRARMRIANAARDVKEKAKDNLQYAQQRGQQGSDDYQYTTVRQST